MNGKWNIKTAYEICTEAIEQNPKSIGASQCASLQVQIKRTFMEVNLEKVYLPNQPMLGKISYQNLKTAYLKVVKITEKELHKYENLPWDAKVNYLVNLKTVENKSFILPDDGDFRKHSIEFKLSLIHI